MPEGAIAVLYGPSNIGKTFVALDWAMSVAAGREWFGRAVSGGTALYIPFEGGARIGPRITAWKVEAGMEPTTPLPVWFAANAIPLANGATVFNLLDAIRGLTAPVKLIVIDTMARAFVGDENTAQDSGNFINIMETLRSETGATILIIHHEGKNADSGARGSSALRGAADTMIRLGSAGEGIALSCEKQKDAEAFADVALALRKIELGEGLTSCVVVEGVGKAKATGIGALSAIVRRALVALGGLGVKGATSKEWQSAAGIAPSTFYKALGELERAGLAGRPGLKPKGERYTLTEAGAALLSDSSPGAT